MQSSPGHPGVTPTKRQGERRTHGDRCDARGSGETRGPKGSFGGRVLSQNNEKFGEKSTILPGSPNNHFYKWLFQLDDFKPLHRKWLFHQTSNLSWLFGVPGRCILDRGHEKLPFWVNQAMQIYGNLLGILPKIAMHCVGWLYNHHCLEPNWRFPLHWT